MKFTKPKYNYKTIVIKGIINKTEYNYKTNFIL
jgi:hypothetical protein